LSQFVVNRIFSKHATMAGLLCISVLLLCFWYAPCSVCLCRSDLSITDCTCLTSGALCVGVLLRTMQQSPTWCRLEL
jgi:hypothetical protein